MTKAAEDDKDEIYLSSCETRAYLIARETVSVVLLCFPVLRFTAHHKCCLVDVCPFVARDRHKW